MHPPHSSQSVGRNSGEVVRQTVIELMHMTSRHRIKQTEVRRRLEISRITRKNSCQKCDSRACASRTSACTRQWLWTQHGGAMASVLKVLQKPVREADRSWFTSEGYYTVCSLLTRTNIIVMICDDHLLEMNIHGWTITVLYPPGPLPTMITIRPPGPLYPSHPLHTRTTTVHSLSEAVAPEGSEETKHWGGGGASHCLWSMACPSNALFAQSLPAPVFGGVESLGCIWESHPLHINKEPFPFFANSREKSRWSGQTDSNWKTGERCPPLVVYPRMLTHNM